MTWSKAKREMRPPTSPDPTEPRSKDPSTPPTDADTEDPADDTSEETDQTAKPTMMSRQAMPKKRKKTRRTAPSESSQRKSRKTTNQVKTSVTAKTRPKIADDDQDVDDLKMNRETKTRIVTNANEARTKMIADRDVAVVADTVDAVEAVADIAEEVAEEEVVADQEDAGRTVEAAVEVAMGVRPSLMTPRSKRIRACLKNYIAKKP